MISLNGYLKRTLSRFSILILIGFLVVQFLPPTQSTAQEDDIEVSPIGYYEINTDGDLNVDLKLNLKSSSSESKVIRYYKLEIPFTNPSSLEASQGSKLVPIQQENNSNSTLLTLDLKNVILSPLSPLSIKLSFTIDEYSTKGEDKSIVLPTILSGEFYDDLQIRVSEEYGEITYIVGSSSEIIRNKGFSVIELENPSIENIQLMFEEILGYSFEFERTLSNSGESTIVSELLLPKSNGNQQFTISSINPMPDIVYQDDQENTFLAYSLNPNEDTTVRVKGELFYIKTTSTNKGQLSNDLISTTGYWNLEDMDQLRTFDLFLKTKGIRFDSYPVNIRTIEDNKTRESFYKATYDYVTQFLMYNENELEDIPEIRQGSKSTILGSNSASVDDYSDLMITLLRYYGIPATMEMGYVTNISASFEGNFLHNWVSYYDDENGWQYSDPFLGDLLTKDFSILDGIDRVTFASRGESPITPSKAVFSVDTINLSIIENPIPKETLIDVEVNIDSTNALILSSPGFVSVTNIGNTLINQITIDLPYYLEIDKSIDDLLILPGEKVIIPLEFSENSKDLLKPRVYQESIRLGARSVNQDSTSISTDMQIEIENFWWWNSFMYAISTFIFLIAVLAIALTYRLLKKKGIINIEIIDK
jgi:hypothetical protein